MSEDSVHSTPVGRHSFCFVALYDALLLSEEEFYNSYVPYVWQQQFWQIKCISGYKQWNI
jgi:hypothetical protein